VILISRSAVETVMVLRESSTPCKQSLLCKVKRKGKFFWICFQGSNADSFWKIIEPYVLDSFASSEIQKSGGIGSDGSQDSDTDYQDDHKRSDRENDEQRQHIFRSVVVSRP
jgi:hypothetical protein